MSFPFQEHHGWLDQQTFRLKVEHHRRSSVIEYAIGKMYKKSPEFWEGPYKTLKAALGDFKKMYANPPHVSQDFEIFKITTTKVKTKWTKKSGPRRASR